MPPWAAQSSLEIDTLLSELAGKLPDKEVAGILARATGAKRNAIYRRLLDLRDERRRLGRGNPAEPEPALRVGDHRPGEGEQCAVVAQFGSAAAQAHAGASTC